MKVIWIAPDAVLALALAFRSLVLQPKPIQKESPSLRPDKLWRIACIEKSVSRFFVALTESSWDIYARGGRPKSTSPQLGLDEARDDLSDFKSERCTTFQRIAIKDQVLAIASTDEKVR